MLLAVLQLGADARAIDLRERLERRADRSVSRGALYATLDRLEKKGFLDWKTEGATPERGGIPRRVFRVTEAGLEAVRASQRAIDNLSAGLDEALERR